MSERPAFHLRIAAIFRSRIRLWMSVAAGVLIVAVLPAEMKLGTRILVAWNLSAVLYLTLTFAMILDVTPKAMRQRAIVHQEGRWIVLSLVAAAAVAALFATVQIVHGLKSLPPGLVPLHLALSGATIVSSWLFMNVNLALIYAHEYFGPASAKAAQPALDFPSEDEPDYWDFIYFSLVIGMTFQVSDVAIRSKLLRRLATLHGVISFFFNTVILALSVNIAASVL